MEIRTSKPGKGNKYYITKKSGGWSPCIKGKPTDKNCDVLANCVGYAVGRFNEESNEGKIALFTSMNAENFYANASKWGCKTGKTPKQGAIMCWAKGKVGNVKDGAGHVAIVEKVYSDTKVLTSESGYNSFAFKNKTRTKGKNGQWGTSSPYKFLGFIYNPHLKEIPKIKGVAKDTNKNQILVKVNNLKVYNKAGTNGEVVGYAVKDNYYNYSEISNDWYKIGDKKWVVNAKDGSSFEVIPKTEPKPTPKYKLKVGDKVRIIGKGYSNASGKGGHAAGGIGLVRYVKKIHSGKTYPYQVGNNEGTTGFYKEKSLRKL